MTNKPAPLDNSKEDGQLKEPEIIVGDGYKPATWERILAAICAVAILVLVFIVVLRKTPFTDQNQVVLIRIVLSLAVGIIGAVVPGFLQVNLSGKGVVIRAGGALALFVITFFFSPRVLPLAVNLEKIERTNEEIRSDVGRIVTKFNSIFLQTVYELPESEHDVMLLKDSLVEITRAVQKDGKIISQGLTLSSSTTKDNPSGSLITSIELDHLLDEQFVKLSPKLIDLVPFITFLRQPKLQVGINRSLRESSILVNSFLGLADPPDLHLFVHSWPVDPQNGNFGKIILDVEQKKVLVAWNGFEYPQDKWATSRKVLSIQDLEYSQFVAMLSKAGSVDQKIDNIVSQFVPVWINVRFDNNFVTFNNFERVAPVQKWQAFSAKFPSARIILDGKASHPINPSYSWGF